MNDEPPVFSPLPESCVMITEFHDPGETVYSLKASDADDPNTPNGWVSFSILAGNEGGKIRDFSLHLWNGCCTLYAFGYWFKIVKRTNFWLDYEVLIESLVIIM